MNADSQFDALPWQRPRSFVSAAIATKATQHEDDRDESISGDDDLSSSLPSAFAQGVCDAVIAVLAVLLLFWVSGLFAGWYQ